MAQKNKVDELLPRLKQTHEQTAGYISLLNEISLAYSLYQVDSAFTYADRAYLLAVKQNDKRLIVDALINKMWALGADLKYNVMKKLLQEASTLSAQINYQRGTAYCLLQQTYLEQSITINDSLCKKAISILEKLNNAQDLATGYFILQNCHFYVSQQHTKPYILKAIEMASKAGDSAMLASCIMNYGSTFGRTTHSDSSYYYYKIAREMNERIGANVYSVADYCNLAAYYYFVSDYPMQLKYLLKSIHVADLAGIKVVKAGILNQLGIIYFDMKRYDVAKKYLLECIEVTQQSVNNIFLSNAAGYLGSTYQETNNYDSAYYWLNVSLKSALITGDNVAIGSAYLNMGDYYRVVKDYNKSFFYFNKAIDIDKSIQDNFNLGYIYFSYAKVIINASDKELAAQNITPSNRFETARNYALQSLTLSRENSNPIIARDALLELSHIAEKENNPAQSFNYYKQYVTLKDSIMNTDNAHSIATMQIEYDSEKQQQQIVSLTKDKQLKQAEVAKQKTQRNILMTACALVLVLIGFIVNRYMVKTKATKEIEKTYNHLLQTQQQLVQQGKLVALAKMTADVAQRIKEPIGQIKNLSPQGEQLVKLYENTNNEEEKASILQQIKTYLTQINSNGVSANDVVKDVLQQTRKQTA